MKNLDSTIKLPDEVLISIKDSRKSFINWVIDKEIIQMTMVALLAVFAMVQLFNWTGI